MMQTFISYAQNFEDVILWRSLSGISNGFYVDVGAQHPLKDSVTRAFYERGWRGINIDPVPAWHGLLAVDRPEDLNLQIAVGAAEGEAVFYEVDETGLSTMDARLAARYSVEGRLVRMSTVQVRTLDSILGEFAPADIHFLKIDVEGVESEVLAGISLQRYRPWIVLVEATLPNTQEDVSHAWEALLTDAGYLPAYFDGLNRFFVAEERRELLRHFALPPNYFDSFVRHPDWEMAELARRLSEEKQAWLVEADSLKEELAVNQDQLAVREQFWKEELAASQDQLVVREQFWKEELAASQDQLAAREQFWKEELAASQGQLAVREQFWKEELAASQDQLAVREQSWKEELAASQDQLVVREQSWKEEFAASQQRNAGLKDSLQQSEQTLISLQAQYEEVASGRANDMETISFLRQEQVSTAREFHLRLEQSQGAADWLSLQLRQRNHVLDRVLASRSWKLTAPLRWLSSTLGVEHPLEQDELTRDSVPPAEQADIDVGVCGEQFSGVPCEQTLLDLASRKDVVVDERLLQDVGLPESVGEQAVASRVHRFDQLIGEAGIMLTPPGEVPARMRSLPFMAWFAPYVLRIYERLFRRQTLFNAKIIEALQILRDRND